MKRGGIRLMGGLSVAALSTAFASSCSSPPRTPTASAPLSTYAVRSPLPTGRIAQMEFGRRAAFARCVSPACPAVTPKTLAMERPAGPATLSSSNPGSSLAAGEAFVTSGAAPSPLAAPVVTLSSAATAAKSTRQVIVHFGFGDASLTATTRAQIDEVAGSMPSANRIAISGRTDSVGSPQSNQTLAVARANAVRDHLRARYPHLATAVTLEAQGTCCFVAPNDSPQSCALNRRVEIVFERDTKDL
ncbi:MAG: OmpA family protein [Burkholderiales bacterium]|nr:OmpA family protein [Burkholderiales bacterium]